MEIWRKMQIATAVFAVVAVAMTVATVYFPNVVYGAMWAWSITLWLVLFLGPMPVIERNKKNHQIALALFFLAAVFGAVSINTWLQIEWPETHGFSRGVMVYSAFYLVAAYVFAAWLKMKEKKNK
jgi:TctA family transporter